ncbi:MAG: HAD hydrolase-like protein [Candidatus Adlerbacteria bacterium]|nr:HAD hydrolase-like protein [Candidatus Adlerbacteria bacterium]
MNNILIFDYDGVIVDSLEVFRKTLVRACEVHGYRKISDKSFLNLFNKNMYEGLFELGISKEKIPDILRSLETGLLDAQNGIHLFEGIDSSLRELSINNKIFIITSNIGRVVQKFLESKNIDYYQSIIGGEKESSKVLKIETIKTQFPNHNYFYIGDTGGDILEGKKAGVKTVAVTWGWHSESLLAQKNPDYIVHSPEELIQVLL